MIQPPPDRPAPSEPDSLAMDSRIKAKMILWLGIFSILGCMVIFGLPRLFPGHRPYNPRTEALNNMRNIGMAMMEFDNEYGQYPDASTAAAVKAVTSTPLTLGSHSSNQLFRQLLPMSPTEKMFWAKTAVSPTKPDDLCATDATALVKGECAFGYIAGLSSSSDQNAPLLFAPIVPGKREFDPKPFKGSAVIYYVDGSAKALPIDQKGKVIVSGMDIFDSRQPYWGGKAPDIKWPE